MKKEPDIKRSVAFIDGQNLFHSVKEAFGYSYPNYDPLLLSREICNNHNWNLLQVRFYTGIPDVNDDPVWNHFWIAKLAVMGTRGIVTYQRSLRYRTATITSIDNDTRAKPVGNEKGIDIRIALDAVRLAREEAFDVALLFSQDQDFSEVANEIRAISQAQDRWIKIACAFPFSETYNNEKGIYRTDWIKFDKVLYDKCIDPNDYRPKGVLMNI